MLEEGEDINTILREFTHDWQSCQILVAHNLEFDNKIFKLNITEIVQLIG